MESDVFVVAAVQAAPVFLDRDATVEKGVQLIEEAAGNGAKLVAFPETWIPAIPLDLRCRRLGRPALETDVRAALNGMRSRSRARRPTPSAGRAGSGAHVVVGIHERDRSSQPGRSTTPSSSSPARARSSASIASSSPPMPSASCGARATARPSTSSTPRSGGSAARLLGALDAAHSLRHARQGRADPRCSLARCARDPPPRESALRLRGALLRPVRGLVHHHADLPDDFELVDAMATTGEAGGGAAELLIGGSGIIGPDGSWVAEPVEGARRSSTGRSTSLGSPRSSRRSTRPGITTGRMSSASPWTSAQAAGELGARRRACTTRGSGGPERAETL